MIRILPILLLLFFMNPAVAFEAQITGRVVGVHDGDTITVLNADKKSSKVRLAEIDTPESAQPYGAQAKSILSGLVFNKTADVQVDNVDKYERLVGHVSVNGIDINTEMIRLGAAWVYRQYSEDPTLLALEAKARAQKIGLWALPEAQQIPPWEWRKNPETTRKDLPIKGAESFTCAGKTYCREMISCAEAKFYLAQCGLSRLDGDKDGVPCEKICQ